MSSGFSLKECNPKASVLGLEIPLVQQELNRVLGELFDGLLHKIKEGIHLVCVVPVFSFPSQGFEALLAHIFWRQKKARTVLHLFGSSPMYWRMLFTLTRMVLPCLRERILPSLIRLLVNPSSFMPSIFVACLNGTATC